MVGDGLVVSRPRGTVTFLLTDVEGSTRRWDTAPDAMAQAIPRHYELIADAISPRNGYRPVEQGEGDSVVGAFSRASDALVAALAAQRALATEPWPEGADIRVRMAIHTGEAVLRSPGYLGDTLNRGARIRATGHGGQVLLSSATASLVADHLPPDAALVDLGLHRLKDLGRPEHIWQLRHPDLEAAFPPLRSIDQFRHNLPVQLTPLIGRAAEVHELVDLLGGERLVTLTGSAGVGKTRLALAVAAEAIEAYPGGIWWVDLSVVRDSPAIGRAVLAALGSRDRPNECVAEGIATALGDTPALLVLDNCEHLVSGCAELVVAVLEANPSASMLTTSREHLGVPGEVSWRVPSMGDDAVTLFTDRAR